MMQRTTVTLVDDVDGGAAAETIEFALDGVAYQVDLSAKNAAKLRRVLQPWVGAARRTGGRRRPPVSRGDSAAIRNWAPANGFDVAVRGRVPAEVVAAYMSAKRR